MKKLFLFITLILVGFLAKSQIANPTGFYVNALNGLTLKGDTIGHFFTIVPDDTIVSKSYVDSLTATLGGGHATETDPIFTSHLANTITSSDTTWWGTNYWNMTATGIHHNGNVAVGDYAPNYGRLRVTATSSNDWITYNYHRSSGGNGMYIGVTTGLSDERKLLSLNRGISATHEFYANGKVRFFNYGSGSTFTGTVENYLATDANGNLIVASGTSGSGDDWGKQVVQTDATLTGDGTSANPLSVVSGGSAMWESSSGFINPINDENILIGGSAYPLVRFVSADFPTRHTQLYFDGSSLRGNYFDGSTLYDVISWGQLGLQTTGLLLSNSANYSETNGSIRYNGTDILGKIGGSWVSLTSGSGSGGESLWAEDSYGINYAVAGKHVGIGSSAESGCVLSVDRSLAGWSGRFRNTNKSGHGLEVVTGNTSGSYNALQLANSQGTIMYMRNAGNMRLHKYGQGSFGGTVANYLAVDASGNVIEAAGTGGGSSQWTDQTYGIAYTAGNVGIGANPISSAFLVQKSISGGNYMGVFSNTHSSQGHGLLVQLNHNSSSYNALKISSPQAANLLTVQADGNIRLQKYGKGSVTGTATKYLAVDTDGYLIEENFKNLQVSTLTGTTPNYDQNRNYNAKITLSGNTTITMPAWLKAGDTGNITVTNAVTAYTVKFSGYTVKISPFLNSSSGAITMSGSSKIDVLSWWYDGTYLIINGTLGYD